MKRIGLAFALALLASPVAAQDVIEGAALALDGDTILVTPKDGKAVTVRLWGIDAPEMSVWPWGPLARGALDRVLSEVDSIDGSGNRVRCYVKGQSRNRIVALCVRIDLASPPASSLPEGVVYSGFDIAVPLVRNGYAVEWRSFSTGTYFVFEDEARVNRRGVWKTWESLKFD